MGGLRKADKLSEMQEQASAPKPATRYANKGEQFQAAKASKKKSQHIVAPEDGANLAPELVTLGRIKFDGSNARTRYINVANPTKNEIDKEKQPKLHAINQKVIDDIVALSEHLKVEPLRQEYAIYREGGELYVAYGHRRHLALKLAFGDNYARHFKVYPGKPADLDKIRWTENVSRTDVPLAFRIMDFRRALDNAIEQAPEAKSDAQLAAVLGQNKGTFSVYRRASESEIIMTALEDGLIENVELLRTVVSKAPKSLEEIESILLADPVSTEQTKAQAKEENPKQKSKGRPTSQVILKLNKPTVIRQVIEGGLAKFDWSDVDFDDMKSINTKLKECIEALIAEAEEQ